MVSDKEVSIDQEIKNLEALYEETRNDLMDDIDTLKKRVTQYKEPESAEILNEKIYQEREYL